MTETHPTDPPCLTDPDAPCREDVSRGGYIHDHPAGVARAMTAPPPDRSWTRTECVYRL